MKRSVKPFSMTVAAKSLRRKRAAATKNARSPAKTPLYSPQSADLLTWYDRHRRTLPWRALLGIRPDPYRVWLSEIMLQQTTVKTVAPYFLRFVERWPDVAALAAAPLDDVLRLWAGLGYYARARNLHACAKAVAERHGGLFPRTEPDLIALPGIGPYTAAAIAAIAFDAPAVPVDGNVERVVTRLFAVETELPGAKPEIARLARGLAPTERHGDFAQALMDLGATICTPKNPACTQCPWTQACVAQRRGDAERFPVKAPKRAGRLRRGAAFVVVRRDDQLLVRTRPSRGLLGGMTEVPTTAWSHDFDVADALGEAPDCHAAKWRRVPGVVTHVFTHFPLELTVFVADVPAGVPAMKGARWIELDAVADEALPTVMRKVVAHALGDRYP
jgi:A/G-specific adenine glycosylase